MERDVYEHILKISIQLESMKNDLISIVDLRQRVENLEKEKMYYKGVGAVIIILGTIISTVLIEVLKVYLKG